MTMRIAIEETGSMTHKELKAWRERLGLTQGEAACLLGMGDRTYQRHEAGGFFRSRVPGYLFAATHGAEAALEKAEELLKVSRWNCPYRFWNKALTPEEGPPLGAARRCMPRARAPPAFGRADAPVV